MNFSEKLPFPDNPPEKPNSDEEQDSQRIKKGKRKKESKEKKELELYYVEVTEQCSSGGNIIQALTMASSPESARHNVMVNYNQERDIHTDNFVEMNRPILYSSMSKEKRESLKKHTSLANLQSIGRLSGGAEVLSNDEEYYILETDQNAIHKPTEGQWEEIQSFPFKK